MAGGGQSRYTKFKLVLKNTWKLKQWLELLQHIFKNFLSGDLELLKLEWKRSISAVLGPPGRFGEALLNRGCRGSSDGLNREGELRPDSLLVFFLKEFLDLIEIDIMGILE